LDTCSVGAAVVSPPDPVVSGAFVWLQPANMPSVITNVKNSAKNFFMVLHSFHVLFVRTGL
jgi:hypothetical protein